jgi:hypothetical protein
VKGGEGEGQSVTANAGRERGSVWESKSTQMTDDPDGLKADDDDHVDLEWKVVSTAEDFKTTGGVPPPTTFTVRNIRPFTAHVFRVRAFGLGWGLVSEESAKSRTSKVRK